jgi:hypothetical protein
VKGFMWWLLHRNREENRGVGSGVPRGEEDGGGGGGVWCGRCHMEEGGERGPASRQLRGSGGEGCGSGGVRRHVEAGEPAEGLNWAGPERTVPF